MKIKTILEIASEVMHINYETIKNNNEAVGDATFKEIEEITKRYTEQFIDYIADNVDVDYNINGKISCEDQIEVYCPKGQFLEFKKLIK